MTAMTSSKWPNFSYEAMSSSTSSGLTMMCSAQICARRNSWCSTHVAFTSFHVRVELALRAASTAAWCSPRCIRHVARRAKLEIELKSIFAASYMASSSSARRRPGCGPRWAPR